jgi:hypothetical protein
VIAVDPIPTLGVGQVIPGTVPKRDSHMPTSEPSDVMAGRIPARSPMERSGSAECQPKLVITKPQHTMPTHVRPPDAHDLSGAAAGAWWRPQRLRQSGRYRRLICADSDRRQRGLVEPGLAGSPLVR